MNCGIYKITNTVNGKVYIGSSIHLDKRWEEHLWYLKNNKHHSIHLQNAWNKYGSFIFEILLYCDKENLVFYEQRAIDEYRSLNNLFGYNAAKVQRSDLIGSNYDKMCQRMSESKKGEKHYLWGKKHSEETRKRMSEALKGKNNPLYGKKGKDSPRYGKKHSEETRNKMSENHADFSGKNHPRAKPVIANGKHYSTIKEAAFDLQVDPGTIRYRIKTNKQGYSYASKNKN